MSGVDPQDATRRLLLDTHVFLWWQEDSSRLTPALARQIGGADQVYVSVVTAWELAIKSAVGKLQTRESFRDAVEANRFGLLPITLDHATAVAELPPPERHRDPFDRMLIAQARHEQLTLVTHDRVLGRYAVPILWA